MEADLSPPGTTNPLWLDTCGDDLSPRPALPGDRDADIAIVGAGYTGLWTAHHLLRHDPTLRVVVLERETAGWGASGRNGGWCSALFPTSWHRLGQRHGTDAAQRMRAVLRRTVGDVGDWCGEHGVDFVRGGTLTLARGSAQVARLHRNEGWLTATEAQNRVHATNVDGGVFDPHCAALHPAKLVRALARTVESQGGVIFEQTAVQSLMSGRVQTSVGAVRADVVVQATEGYTCELPGQRRSLAPIRSLVIATAPLPSQLWDEIGWDGRETLADDRHVVVYAQRSADDRIVLGGRGAPYRFRSGTGGTAGYAKTHAALEAVLHELFPGTVGLPLTHRWGGVLGAPRDWMPSVRFDAHRRVAAAGGYVGDGVACAALAGSTLADLILQRATDDTTLPWVGHRSPRWEPEPFRWAGISALNAVMASADRGERRTGKPSRRAAAVQGLIGG
ncbi:MAG TPA: FAD-dependent oxidoreductase [Mycobacteriales bacterium]|nr:FAD-dependent oxidoreductase [Mycobacteriales bacterium]